MVPTAHCNVTCSNGTIPGWPDEADIGWYCLLEGAAACKLNHRIYSDAAAAACSATPVEWPEQQRVSTASSHSNLYAVLGILKHWLRFLGRLLHLQHAGSL